VGPTDPGCAAWGPDPLPTEKLAVPSLRYVLQGGLYAKTAGGKRIEMRSEIKGLKYCLAPENKEIMALLYSDERGKNRTQISK
jgi:hypothetical protein